MAMSTSGRDDLRRILTDLLDACDGDVLIHIALMERRMLNSLTFVIDRKGSLGQWSGRLEAALRRSEPSPLLRKANKEGPPPPETPDLQVAVDQLGKVVGEADISFRERAALTNYLHRRSTDTVAASAQATDPNKIVSLVFVVGGSRGVTEAEIKTICEAAARTFFAERRFMSVRAERYHNELVKALSEISSRVTPPYVDPSGPALVEAYCTAVARCLGATYVLAQKAEDTAFRLSAELWGDASDPAVIHQDFVRLAVQQGIVTLQRDDDAAHLAAPIRNYIVGRPRLQNRVLVLTRPGPAIRAFDAFDELLATQACARIARTLERSRRRQSMQAQRRLQQTGNLGIDRDRSSLRADLPTGELRRIAELTTTLVRDIQDIAEATSASLRLLAPSRTRPNELALWQVAVSGFRGDSPLCQESGEGTNWATIRSGEPVYVPDWEASEVPARFRRDTRSSLTVPVFDSTTLIGTLNLESVRPADFLEHVSDAVEYATLAGRACDLVRMTAWTQYVRSTALEHGELHVLANDLWTYKRRYNPPGLAAIYELERIERAVRDLLTARDASGLRAAPATLRDLLTVGEGWHVEESAIYDTSIRPEVAPVLSIVVAELLRNANTYTPYHGSKQLTTTQELFNGAEWVVLGIVNETLTTDDKTVSELFRAVDHLGAPDRVGVGTVQCGWLASLIGGRLDAWQLSTPAVSVQFRLPPHCFNDN